MTAARIAAATLLVLAAPVARAQSPVDFLPREPGAETPPPATVAPPEDLGAPAAVTPPGPAEPGPRFVLRGVTLEGASAVSEADLAPIWAGLIGREVTIAALEDVVANVTAAYRARGYVLSQALLPPQTVKEGVVRIAVIEGFVDRVAIAGGAANQQDYAALLFAPLTEEQPMRLQTLERGVLLARDTFGEGVETVLEPSPETFGAADLGVLIEPDPWTGFAAVDNRGSRLYGPLTLGAGASVYNMLGFNERIDALIAFAPENNSLAFGQMRLDAPIAALSGTALDGSRFSVEADRSRADPDLSQSGSPQDLDVIQNETNVGVAMFTPFVRTRAENLFGRVALVWRESESLTGFAGSDDTDQDRLLVVQARVTWDVADSFGGVTLVDGWLHQGISIDGVTETSGSGPAAGDDTFTLGALNLSRLQRLGATDWSLYGLFIGQYAADNLPNSERFTLGDATIGRGFAPGNTSGDSGYGVRLELRRLVAGPENGEYFGAAEAYGFVDYGQAYDRAQARDGDVWETLSSAGIGARIDVRDWLTITPEIARQARGIATDTTDTDLETRFYLGVIARF